MRRESIHERGLAALLEAALPRWRGRLDSEHEQAVIRLLIGAAAAIFLVTAIMRQGRYFFTDQTFYLIVLFFICSICIVGWLMIDPGISRIRRLLGAVIDIAASTMALHLNGNLAAPLFVVYLWVIFGNGFRFGKRYLYFSMVLSVAGYSWVIYTSPHWQIPPQVTYGLLISLIVLPLYVATLLSRLTETMMRLEKANAAKSTFLAVMSHEIRTPLSGILGLIRLIKNTELSDRQNHYLHLLEKSSDWLHRVISDGLDFSKIEADEFIIDISPFSPARQLADLVDFYQGVAEEKNVCFRSTIDPELPAGVAGDEGRLTQVLTNLLANAFKFTEEGEVQLQVKVNHADDTEATVTFIVSDTGIGISQDEIGHIFQPFRQADSTTARKFGGTGLGLAIAERIVRMMGGTIAVESRNGGGTTFSFSLTLPVAALPESAAVEGLATNLSPQWLRPPRVLLVEDNEINREVLQQLLKVAGCAVEVAEDGKIAIEKAANAAFDLIFMDCQMPLIDGYEATRQIRGASSPQHIDIPIVALTAHVTVADKDRCLAAGMDDYLGKPCTLAGLTSTLKKWLPALLAESNAVVNSNSRETEPIVPREAPALSVPDTENRRQVHDLRNYFTKIIGNAELALLKSESPEEVRGYLESILAETRKETARSGQRAVKCGDSVG